MRVSIRTGRRLCKRWSILQVKMGTCRSHFALKWTVFLICVSLLDIGPTAEGEIIQPERDGLLQTGSWLQHSGQCVFDTVCCFHYAMLSPCLIYLIKAFWFQGSQDIPSTLSNSSNTEMRFLTTLTTFCIVAFSPPTNGSLVINKRLPILEGDQIFYLSANGSSNSLSWTMDAETGRVTVDVNSAESDIDQGQFAWAFEVRYRLRR
jgi:alpha-L-fucosidase